jgi:hypothetical protein
MNVSRIDPRSLPGKASNTRRLPARPLAGIALAALLSLAAEAAQAQQTIRAFEVFTGGTSIVPVEVDGTEWPWDLAGYAVVQMFDAGTGQLLATHSVRPARHCTPQDGCHAPLTFTTKFTPTEVGTGRYAVCAPLRFKAYFPSEPGMSATTSLILTGCMH